MISEIIPMEKFPSSDISPGGWYGGFLRMQADGLLGNLDKISPEVKESKWLGFKTGDYDSLPLWLEGFIPTAWLLSDSEMQERAILYVKKITENHTGGWIPKKNAKDGFDIASLFVMLNMLCEYAEVSDNEDTDDIICRALYELDAYTDSHSLSQRAQLCWYEALRPISREAARTNDIRLKRLGKKLCCMGFDWIKYFDGWDYAGISGEDIPKSFLSDVRNCVGAIKSAVLLAEFEKDDKYIDIAFNIIYTLEKYHGSAVGMFTGDRILSGKGTEHGIDLTALCDYMQTLGLLQKISGSVECADRLERLAYNAFIGAFSSDMWTHQSIELINQINCCGDGEHVFNTADKAASLFGYGFKDCNIADFCKGFAAFSSVQFMHGGNGTVYISGFAPAVLETVIGGSAITITVSGDYPFRNSARISVTASAPVTFTLAIRVPCWTENMRLSTGSDMTMPNKGRYFTYNGVWSDTTKILIDTNDKFRLTRLSNELYTVSRGALLYAMPINSHKVYTNGNAYPYSEYGLECNGVWNYALAVENKEKFASSVTFEEKAVTAIPFSSVTPPVEMFAYGKRIQWPVKKGSAIHNPFAVATSDKKEMLRFIPYGATDLRIAAFPIININI